MTDINVLYTEFAKEIDKRSKECRESVATCNQIEQDLLHFLENESCDAVTMVMIAKKIQKNRRERRQDKIRLEQIQSIKSTIPSLVKRKNLTEFEEKTYTYKSDVMSEIPHKPKVIKRCKYKEIK